MSCKRIFKPMHHDKSRLLISAYYLLSRLFIILCSWRNANLWKLWQVSISETSVSLLAEVAVCYYKINSARCLADLRICPSLLILHWLRLPERVNFKLALMAYRVLNGMAPAYMNQLVAVSTLSSLPGRRRLRSSFTLQLYVPPYRLSTAGRRSFPVAGSQPSFSGTLCQMMCSLHRLSLPSGVS